MGLFKKKETTHFERDKEGQVIQVTRDGQDVDVQELKMKTGKQLEQEYYKAHPEKHHPTLKKIGSGMQQLDKKIVDYNRTSNIMNPQRIPIGGSPYTRHSTRDNYNPFGSLFDTGMTSKARQTTKKKKPKTQYKIIGGKAYPIASTLPKKKKSERKSTKKRPGLYDPIDFSGW